MKDRVTLKSEVMMLKIQNKLPPSTSVVGYYGLIIVDYHVKFQWKAIGLFTDLTNVVIFLAFRLDLHRHLFESS